MISTMAWDHAARKDSYTLLAAEFGLANQPVPIPFAA
jgi:hypothetical protein